LRFFTLFFETTFGLIKWVYLMARIIKL
jgi:hypothetical protein